jgi:hypothetical protein
MVFLQKLAAIPGPPGPMVSEQQFFVKSLLSSSLMSAKLNIRETECTQLLAHDSKQLNSIYWLLLGSKLPKGCWDKC